MKTSVPITVTMLGDFSLDNGQVTLPDKSDRNRQVWLLLQFLICNRNKVITPERLADVLWGDNRIENTGGALKNLAYRLRTALKAFDNGTPRDYILFKQGAYYWNNDIPVVVDSECMEALFDEADRLYTDDAQKVELLMQAVQLYHGRFLQQNDFETWVQPVNAYLHDLYVSHVQQLCDLLLEQGREADADALVARALGVDALDEKLHLLKMKTLASLGKHQQAMAHYEYAAALMYKEMGVRLSQPMRDMYAVVAACVAEADADLQTIKHDLDEGLKAHEAFYCGYEIFKNIYRLQARRLDRVQDTLFIGLLTLINSKGGDLTGDACENAMDCARQALVTSLRKGDTIARYSRTQYVIMLSSLSMDDCEIVMNKIFKRFYQLSRSGAVQLRHKFMPIEGESES